MLVALLSDKGASLPFRLEVNMNGAKSSVARPRDILPMSIENMTFLVDRLAQDCGPLQFMRELTVNSIQAIALSGDETGTITWDVDWLYYELTGVYKLCCIDTGVGMTGPEMADYINKLSSSIHEQAASKNFGIGAKIAAAPLNKHGLIYRSWKNGQGAMVELYFDAGHGIYGLKAWSKNNGEFWSYISDDLKPELITSHGTVVTLMGDSAQHDTMQPPPGAAIPSRWPHRYLNTRFFSLPPGIQIRARQGWELPRDDRGNYLRTVEPEGVWLAKNMLQQGKIPLTNATAHWWILKEDADTSSSLNAGGGHVAALFQDELYEMATGRSGIARLQTFGVIFGPGRVVIYVEPRAEQVMANTARTSLLMEGSGLNWAQWATEFREHLPEEIKNLQEEIGARASEKDHRKAILDRLKCIQDLLRFSRFRPTKNGSAELSSGAGTGIKRSGGRNDAAEPRTPPEKPARPTDVFELFTKAGSSRGEAIPDMNEPHTKWVSVHTGTREPPDLDEAAAKFLPESNLILLNADFRVFTDMIERWQKAYAQIPGARGPIVEVVHEWFEQELIETVMGALALHRAGGMRYDELAELWSESSLTASVLGRYHIDQSIKRHLGQQLGSLKAA